MLGIIGWGDGFAGRKLSHFVTRSHLDSRDDLRKRSLFLCADVSTNAGAGFYADFCADGGAHDS